MLCSKKTSDSRSTKAVMKNINVFAFLSVVLNFLSSCGNEGPIGHTEITKWKSNKRGAISITYDDGNINQFKRAMPIMDSLGLPGTFYIVTGAIPGSQYPPKFIGRPVAEIIEESLTLPTDKSNFFERASAIPYLGFSGTWEYHIKAGQFYESGNIQEAYKVLDDAYAMVRAGKFSKGKDISWEAEQSSENSWEAFVNYASQGHEFGSHSISHPRLAVLDEANLKYELEKSYEDILHHMGADHVFSAECPFGTEDERVMEYAHKVYPSLRNRMPHSFLEELNRASKTEPGTIQKEYVQWQRGALTDVPMEVMKSWVDTVTSNENIWLVLVFHGIDDKGWEPRTTADVETYFKYIKEKQNDVWIDTFKNVTKYIRERMAAEVNSSKDREKIIINLTHSLDPLLYDQDLTLKTYVPKTWSAVQINQDDKKQDVMIEKDEEGSFVVYHGAPNSGPIEIFSWFLDL